MVVSISVESFLLFDLKLHLAFGVELGVEKVTNIWLRASIFG